MNDRLAEAYASLPEYDSLFECPKCFRLFVGSYVPSTEYCDSVYQRHGHHTHCDAFVHRFAHMHRYCHNCGYDWIEQMPDKAKRRTIGGQ